LRAETLQTGFDEFVDDADSVRCAARTETDE